LRSYRRGIARLLEVIMASAILVTSLSVSYFYLVSANPISLRGQSDLNKMGYDLMETLSSQGGFDTSIVNSAGQPVNKYWESRLQVIMTNLMPVGIMYNLTVYEVVNSAGAPLIAPTGTSVAQLSEINNVTITNAQASSFLTAGTTAQITYLYTTAIFPNGNYFILVFTLQLAAAEGM
jgi:hypothetical protein